jgi:23S rRNA pseudouridine2605 synthase
MAYNKPGGRSRKFSDDKGSSKSGGKKVKSGSDDKGSDRKFSKPYSKDKKRSSGEDGFSRNRRSGDDDKKSDFKKDDSFRRNDKYKGSGEKEHHRPFTRKYEAKGDKKFDKPYKKKFDDGGEKKSFDKPYKKKYEDRDDKGSDKPYRKKYEGADKKSFDKPYKKKYEDRDDKGSDKPYRKKYDDGDKKSFDKPYKKKYDDRDDKGSDKPYRKKYDDSGERSTDRPYKKKYEDRDDKGSDKPYRKKHDDSGERSTDRPYKKKYSDSGEEKRFKHDEFEQGKAFKSHSSEKTDFKEGKYRKNKFGKDHGAKSFKKEDDGLTRLNKYLANAGISSRREADTLIESGVVKVNGVVITQMGYKVKQGDVVSYADSVIKNERKVYLLLNKPKDFITTTDDPQERRTVMELIKPACKERIYPVGRLDRNTTGLLLFTNDGELATKLMHPKHEIKKVYHVSLGKALKAEDYQVIQNGFDLEDGPVKVDDIAYVGEGKKEIGLEIHSGRNRIVRRLFEHLGYEVVKLDRVSYAGLTKKDLPRGKYRFLNDREIAFLKMLG